MGRAWPQGNPRESWPPSASSRSAFCHRATSTRFGGGITLIQKRIALLREASPRVRRMALLVNLTNPIHPRILRAAVRAGAPLGITLEEIGVFEATEFGDAFKRIAAKRLDALFVPGDAMFSHHRARLVALAAAAPLPAIYCDR